MSTDQQHSPELADVRVHGITREAFILRGTIAAATAYGAAAAGPFVGRALAADSGDVAILNYALTLEYLETAFYVKGKGLNLSGTAKQYAQEFGAQEAQHVTALKATIKKLGGTPVASPTFVFPVTDQASFLKLASTLENLGVSAYNGAAPGIRDAAVLTAAGSIVQVEARHAAAINLLLGESPTPDGGFDKTKTMDQVLAAAKPLIKT